MVITNKKLVPANKLSIVKAESRSRATQPLSRAIASNHKRTAAMCLVLALVTLGAYAPVLRHPFINYDDDVYILNNSHVNTGLNWQNVRWALTATEAANWHPITWVSHQVDSQLFGLSAGGHHSTNLLLHILNALLLFLLLARVTGATGRSLLVAVLFALHPLNVESVAWIAERKNVLCTFFFLLSLGAYGWYAQRPGLRRYLTVTFLFIFALASKPMAITLPFVLLLLDFWPLNRISGWSTSSPAFPAPQVKFSHLVWEKLPWLVLSAGSGFITIIAQRRADALTSVEGWTLGWRLGNAVHSYAAYLWEVFIPYGLAPFYPGMILPWWLILLAGALLLGIGRLVWKLAPGRPFLITGCLWFVGMMVPVIGLVQVGSQAMADRYAYVPMIGIFTAVVWTAYDAVDSEGRATGWRVGMAAAVLVVLFLLTSRQVNYWRNSVDLWTHALEVTANNFVAETNLALALEGMGHDDEALSHFVNVKRIQPDDVIASLHIGTMIERRGLHQEAITQLDDVVRSSGDPSILTAAYRGLGAAYAQLGQRDKAREYFLRAWRLSPEDSANLYNLSLLETQAAIERISRQVSAHPTAQGYLQLGELLHEERDIPNAQIAYEKALELDPTLSEARDALQRLKSSND